MTCPNCGYCQHCKRPAPPIGRPIWIAPLPAPLPYNPWLPVSNISFSTGATCTS